MADYLLIDLVIFPKRVICTLFLLLQWRIWARPVEEIGNGLGALGEFLELSCPKSSSFSDLTSKLFSKEPISHSGKACDVVVDGGGGDFVIAYCR